MQRKMIAYLAVLAAIGLPSYFVIAKVVGGPKSVSRAAERVTQGSLYIVAKDGSSPGICPLKHTDVKAEISGFISRVVVTQEFENPAEEKIEAVYTFPLPQKAAVDSMVMRIGDRTVRAKIKSRDEARAIYEAAKGSGHLAGLLDQERPNIFTQSVANIMPGEQIKVTISYVETLKYEDGSYEFVFPMVVGPRYIPGAPIGKQGGGWAPDTDRVPDASRITPPVAPEGTRAGHDIAIEVALNAGVPIDDLRSTLHAIDAERLTPNSAVVRLKAEKTIPNKDFILKYDVAGRRIEDAVLTHRSNRGGFFTFILQPPDRIAIEDVTPKELVFVLDTSGSMMGFPIEKAKETMQMALDSLNPLDTFNLITFSGDTHILFPEPVHVTSENLKLAKEFLASRKGSGGTEMMKAIRAALDPSDEQDHIRIVCFMTDGYVGNDMEIIAEVQKHPNARIFAFGVGNSVNRFLLDKMAEYGRGEVEYVTLQDDGSAAARRFHERVRTPYLTDVAVDWGALAVADVYPKLIPDLFSAKPVVLTGRYTKPGRSTIKLRGKVAGADFEREIAVDFPETEPRRDVLSTLWARARVEDLMRQDYNGIQNGSAQPQIRESITQLGLEFNLMTQFTSFVAVEERVVTRGGKPRRIEVPVEMPEGVSHKGVFGEAEVTGRSNGVLGPPSAKRAQVGPGRGYSMGGGTPRLGGIGAGTGGGVGPGAAPPVQPPSTAVASDKAEESVTQSQRRDHSKLHPLISAVIERLKRQDTAPGSDEARFVANGKAEVRLILTDNSAEAIRKLEAIGFEVVAPPKGSKVIIGKISIEKIEMLAKLDFVRYVAPQLK